jgi:vitamin B12 transporter
VDYDAAHSESWDAGIDQTFWAKRIHLSATYFDNQFRDLIQAILVGGTFVPNNVARARTNGVEFVAEADVLDTLRVTSNYTHTNSEDLTAGTPLRRVAPDMLNFGLTWDPIRALSLFAQAYVVSSQFEAVGFPRNPAYHHVDIGGVYHILAKHGAWPALDLLARINNVTDEHYMEVFGFRALGINALAGLQLRY